MFSKIIAAIQNKHFLSLAGNGIMAVVAMVTMAIVMHILPKSTVGIYVFFQASFVLVDTFRSGFLIVPFIKYYAGTDQQRADEVTGSTWYIATLITIGFALINVPLFFVLKLINDVSIDFFLKWFGITYLITLPAFLAACVQQGKQRFDRILYIRIATQGTMLVAIIVLVVMHKLTLQTLMYTFLGSNLFASIYCLLMGWTHIETFNKRSKATIKEIFDFGKFSVTSTLSANLFKVSDVYIINFALGAAGPAAIAIYNLGQSLMQVVEIPLRSFVATGMPALSEAYNQSDKAQVIYTMKKYVGLLTITLIPMVLIAVGLADFGIQLIGGGKYVHTEAANVFRLFMTFALLYPADRFFGVTIDSINMPRINLYKILAMLAANVITDLIGIYITHNVYGVAFATIFPVLVGVIMGYYTLNKYYKFSFFSIYKLGFQETRLIVLKLLKRKPAEV
ncbi:hypothetical protein GCM10027037_01320 [Mucilaginibacter koreensis]